MPILSRCSVTGCRTLTIGDVCIVHDLRPKRAFVRGRPFDSTAPHAQVVVAVPLRVSRVELVGAAPLRD